MGALAGSPYIVFERQLGLYPLASRVERLGPGGVFVFWIVSGVRFVLGVDLTAQVKQALCLKY